MTVHWQRQLFLRCAILNSFWSVLFVTLEIGHEEAYMSKGAQTCQKTKWANGCLIPVVLIAYDSKDISPVEQAGKVSECETRRIGSPARFLFPLNIQPQLFAQEQNLGGQRRTRSEA